MDSYKGNRNPWVFTWPMSPMAATCLSPTGMCYLSAPDKWMALVIDYPWGSHLSGSFFKALDVGWAHNPLVLSLLLCLQAQWKKPSSLRLNFIIQVPLITSNYELDWSLACLPHFPLSRNMHSLMTRDSTYGPHMALLLRYWVITQPLPLGNWWLSLPGGKAVSDRSHFTSNVTQFQRGQVIFGIKLGESTGFFEREKKTS